MRSDDEEKVPPDQQGDDQDHKGDQYHHQLRMSDRSVNKAKVIDRSNKIIVQILRPSANKDTGKRISKPAKRKSKLELARFHNKSQLGVFEFLQKREGKSAGGEVSCVGQRGGGVEQLN